ncbi:SlyX protein [Pandoraea pulmonicola]|jgi:SlyX protein|uniref:Protein SlyX homolog n=1 Tax=Pandoraea pulmonicola TaxID=93221 RepID=A0AAJ5D2B3_PANPU|nr:SlyX protein [Pandoraea pulmonicola]SUA92542.1 SlyX [Pandoraea pulmonicola]
MESLESRVVELEIKAAFQEDLLETLNEIVTRQEQQIDLLQKQFKALYQQMQSQGQSGGNDGNPRHEIPPHY